MIGALVLATGLMTANVAVDVDSKTYVVHYEYDPSFSTVPLTYPVGMPHYSATCTVKRDSQQIGEPFGCTYVEGGCFDADPEQAVRNALKAPGRQE